MLSNIKQKIKEILSKGRLSLVKNYLGQEISIGKACQLKKTILDGKISIGDNCKLYEAHLYGDIDIGRYTSLWGPNIHLYSALNPIQIGNFCSIAKNVTFQEYNHNYRRFTTYFYEKNILNSPNGHKNEIISNGSIEVGHDVWIGGRCTILGGAKIATGAIVAANSVVTGEIPPYAVVGGSPAKILKYRFSEKVRKELLETEWWEWEKDKIVENVEMLRSIVSKDYKNK